MMGDARIESFIVAAKPHYSDTLAYHNFDHAEYVIEKVAFLVRQLARRGFSLAEDAMVIAAAWHDAGYAEDHNVLGFETKEHYSAHLADEYLKKEGLDDTFRHIVRSAILGTIHGLDRTKGDIPGLVLHRADIANLAGPFMQFYVNNVAVWRENQALQGTTIPWEEWTAQTVKFMDFSIAEARRELPELHGTYDKPITHGGSLSLGGYMSFDTLAEQNKATLLTYPSPEKVGI